MSRIISVYPTVSEQPKPSKPAPRLFPALTRVGPNTVHYMDVPGAPPPDQAEVDAWVIASYRAPDNLPPMIAARRRAAIRSVQRLVDKVTDSNTLVALQAILDLLQE